MIFFVLENFERRIRKHETALINYEKYVSLSKMKGYLFLNPKEKPKLRAEKDALYLLFIFKSISNREILTHFGKKTPFELPNSSFHIDFMGYDGYTWKIIYNIINYGFLLLTENTTDNMQYFQVCCLILATISNSHSMCSLLFENISNKFKIHKPYGYYNKQVLETDCKDVDRPVFFAIEFIKSIFAAHLNVAFPANIYENCVLFIHNILMYQIMTKTVDSSINYVSLTCSLLSLVFFITGRIAKKCAREYTDCFVEILHLSLLSLCYILCFPHLMMLNPLDYDNIIYEVVRNKTHIEKATHFLIVVCSESRNKSRNNQIRKNIKNLLRVNNHYSSVIEKIKIDQDKSVFEVDEILEVIRKNYDSLFFKLNTKLCFKAFRNVEYREVSFFRNLFVNQMCDEENEIWQHCSVQSVQKI